jgi:hypothetical protein
MWLTLSAPHQIMYSYRDWNHNTSEELPLRIEAGALVIEDSMSELDFIRHTIRDLLVPVMEAA